MIEWVMSEETGLEPGRQPAWPPGISRPKMFRYFKTSPEALRLAVVIYVRSPLLFRSVEGHRHDFWQTVDHEGVVFQTVAIRRRNTLAATELPWKPMKRHGHAE